MDYSIPGAIYLDQDSKLAKFVFRTRDTSLTSTYVLKHHVGVKKKVLTNEHILDLYQNIPDKEFKDTCGNHYISVLIKGGELHVGIKFSFSSVGEKQIFEMGGSVQSITGLGAHVKSLHGSIKKHSSVEIFFHQQGGDLKELNSMIDSKDIVTCSLDHFDKCENIMIDIWNYSTDRFTKTVLNGKYQTVGFQSSAYAGRPPSYEDTTILKERRFLLDSLDKHNFDSDFISTMESVSHRVNDCDPRCLDALSTKISSNINLLKNMIAMSFKDPVHFLKNGGMQNLDLYAYKIPKYKEQIAQSFYNKPYFWVGVGTLLMLTLLPFIARGNPNKEPTS
jgi:hypothetical protein